MQEGAGPNADMFATPEESSVDIASLYRRVWAHSDATVDALNLDALGHVPWWSQEISPVTLHRVLVHVVAETHRHAGQVDIVRERLDGSAGLRPEAPNLPAGDNDFWCKYRARLQDIADNFR